MRGLTQGGWPSHQTIGSHFLFLSALFSLPSRLFSRIARLTCHFERRISQTKTSGPAPGRGRCCCCCCFFFFPLLQYQPDVAVGMLLFWLLLRVLFLLLQIACRCRFYGHADACQLSAAASSCFGCCCCCSSSFFLHCCCTRQRSPSDCRCLCCCGVCCFAAADCVPLLLS